MPEAFVLLNCEGGREQQILEHLQTLEAVKETQLTIGAYDIIAKLESETERDLRSTIRSGILSQKIIHRVLTLLSS